MGIKDILSRYPEVINSHLGKISERFAELSLDSNIFVRQALHTALNFMMITLSDIKLYPFFPIFVGYMTAGITHLSSQIRHDSLQLILLWLKNKPKLVLKFYDSFIPHFITILTQSAPTTTPSGSKQIRSLQKGNRKKEDIDARKVRVALIEGMSALLHHYFSKPKEVKSTHIEASDFTWEFKTVYHPIVVPLPKSYTLEEIMFEDSSSTSLETSNFNGIDFAKPHSFIDFCKKLVPLLMGCIIECEPDSPSVNNLSHLDKILQILKICFTRLLEYPKELTNSSMNTFLNDLTKYIVPYFPMESQATWTDEQKHLIQRLNVQIVLLLSYFISEEHSTKPFIKIIRNFTLGSFFHVMTKDKLDKMEVEGVQEKNRLSASQISHAINLLPVLKNLLYISDNEMIDELLSGLTAFNNACSSKSSSKRKSVRLIADLMIQEKLQITAERGNKWLKSLAKTLSQCELDNLVLLDYILIRLSQIGIISNFTGKYDFDSICQPLIHVFYKREQADSPSFAFWPIPTQRKLAEVLVHIKHFETNFVEALLQCFKSKSITRDVRNYFAETMRQDQFSDENYMKFIEVSMLNL